MDPVDVGRSVEDGWMVGLSVWWGVGGRCREGIGARAQRSGMQGWGGGSKGIEDRCAAFAVARTTSNSRLW